MRRVLAAAVLVAFMPTANAQDKAKADMSTNAEFRVRYNYMQNPKLDKDDALGSVSGVEHRAKVGLGFKANEKFSAHGTLLHNATWGHVAADTAGIHGAGTTAGAANDGENLLSVNEFYGNWMISDDMSIRLGRQNYQIADGSVIAVNDWEAIPTAFEGLLFNYELEFGKFQLFGFKVRDVAAGTAAVAANTGDDEHNMFGLNFDLKTMPEWLKAVNVHVISNSGDVIGAGAGGNTDTTNAHISTLRYGVMAKFAFNIVHLAAWYNGVTGEAGANDVSSNMMAAKVGAHFENFMNSKVWFKYHQDSGDDDGTDKEDKTYDPLFTERHNSAGMMDLFGWGNLTFMQVGFKGMPADKTEVGLQYTMLSQTEDNDGTMFGSYGQGLALGANDDKLGDMVDLWATHNYDGGLATTLRLGYFMPGDAFKPAEDDILQVFVEGKMTF